VPGAASSPIREETTMNRTRGFTLIEVLVVVAIIALLIAVLIPSLNRARELAKLTTCKANSKQIANMTAQYQAEYRGCVPIMYNYFAYGHGAHDAPARACWLSVALRQYLASGKWLKYTKGGKFDPQMVWYPETGWLGEYENTMIPEFFVCPFARGRGEGEVYVSTDTQFRYYAWEGKHEHYQTWLWRPIIKGTTPGNPWPSPGTSKAGVVKYSNVVWNMIGPNGQGVNTDEKRNLQHRVWDGRYAREAKSGSLGELTAVFCAQGEHIVFQGDSTHVGRVNVNSHRAGGKGGGTSAIFADGHVEWVEGTRIGWP